MHPTPTRGERNNNPGNIRLSASAWRGKVQSRDPEFETFDAPSNGIRALAKLLLAYQCRHGCRTVRQIIERWAPPSENATAAYVVDVARALGVAPDAALDCAEPAVLVALARAVIRHENGRCVYDAATLQAGCRAAMESARAQARPVEADKVEA
jgi:hypothetical protein